MASTRARSALAGRGVAGHGQTRLYMVCTVVWLGVVRRGKAGLGAVVLGEVRLYMACTAARLGRVR